ncbi:phosphoribosylglycinamide formyltransferase 2, partial [Acinetobacter schindleri]
GELGKEVVISLQRLGVEVHAADRYADAPAMQVAHFSYALNMADAAELKQLIQKIQPHLIVPEIEAIATEVLVEIEEQNIATVIP